ncbi:MAG: hypothetical protein ACE5E2_05685 [Candidatus Binatia bacterium]
MERMGIFWSEGRSSARASYNVLTPGGGRVLPRFALPIVGVWVVLGKISAIHEGKVKHHERRVAPDARGSHFE